MLFGKKSHASFHVFFFVFLPCSYTEAVDQNALVSKDTNLAAMADSIVQGCKYLHNSRTEEIEQLLIRLRKATVAAMKEERQVPQNVL